MASPHLPDKIEGFKWPLPDDKSKMVSFIEGKFKEAILDTGSSLIRSLISTPDVLSSIIHDASTLKKRHENTPNILQLPLNPISVDESIDQNESCKELVFESLNSVVSVPPTEHCHCAPRLPSLYSAESKKEILEKGTSFMDLIFETLKNSLSQIQEASKLAHFQNNEAAECCRPVKNLHEQSKKSCGALNPDKVVEYHKYQGGEQNITINNTSSEKVVASYSQKMFNIEIPQCMPGDSRGKRRISVPNGLNQATTYVTQPGVVSGQRKRSALKVRRSLRLSMKSSKK